MNPKFASLSPAEQEVILNGPALAPPHNVVPNFTNPSNLNELSYTIASLSLFLSTLFVILRAYGKWYLMRVISVGDFLMITAYLFFIGFVSLFFYSLSGLGFHGIFVHQWDVQFKNLREFLIITFIGKNFYILVVCFLKTAILLEWLRIFSPAGDRSRFFWACHATWTFNVIWWTQSLIVVNVQCIPYALIFDKTLEGSCIEGKLFEVINAIVNLIMDLVILALPQRIIWRLHLSTVKRVELSFVFAIGLLACISAAGRLWYEARYWLTNDGTYNYSAVGLWSIAEMTCGILVLTTPTVPKALGGLGLGKIFSAWTRYGSSDKVNRTRASFKADQNNSSRRQCRGIDAQNRILLESIDPISVEIDLQQNTTRATGIIRTTQVITVYEDAPRNPSFELGLQHPWTPYIS